MNRPFRPDLLSSHLPAGATLGFSPWLLNAIKRRLVWRYTREALLDLHLIRLDLWYPHRITRRCGSTQKYPCPAGVWVLLFSKKMTFRTVYFTIHSNPLASWEHRFQWSDGLFRPSIFAWYAIILFFKLSLMLIIHGSDLHLKDALFVGG